MRLTACGSARAFGRWIPVRRFASPGMTVPCLPHRCHPGRRPGIHCRGRWAMRLTACGSARAFGRWIPVRRFASPGMTVRCLPHRRHPGRRPGIHCRGRWATRLTACGSARAFGRWIPVRRFASPGMTVPCLAPPLSSRAKTRDPLPRSMGDEAYGLRIGPGGRPLDPGSALRFARDDNALSVPVAVIPGRVQSAIAVLGSLAWRQPRLIWLFRSKINAASSLKCKQREAVQGACNKAPARHVITKGFDEVATGWQR